MKVVRRDVSKGVQSVQEKNATPHNKGRKEKK